MNCNKAHVLMSVAVDGELTLKEEQMFLLHLSECELCRLEYEEAKKTKMIIREKIVRFNAPPSLVNMIMQLSSVDSKKTENSLSL
ncbi:MAG: zf-HC2 domain-containing protein [Chlorobiaceae bacterium]|nr:zf-HC2 domain-containing protein [Chlorobiaceae bacterium]NTV60330.1 zf-HC2 domain-containing protein [Chlorobiaceae bacterium]